MFLPLRFAFVLHKLSKGNFASMAKIIKPSIVYILLNPIVNLLWQCNVLSFANRHNMFIVLIPLIKCCKPFDSETPKTLNTLKVHKV